MNRDRTRTKSRRSPLALAAVASLAAVAGLAACGGSGSSAPASNTSGPGGASASPRASSSVTVEAGANCASGNAVKITFWAWVPGLGRAVNAFNQTHPGICVTQEDVGAGDPEYVAIANALKAGTGAPDVAEVEYDELPSFVITKSVVNLVPYGADNYKNDFVPWAWQEVSQGPAVYAIPGDAGPMAFYYNSALLAKYHIAPPATWAQFAADAATLHKDDPSAYLTNFAAVDLQWIMSLMAQAGAWPFGYAGGSTVTINWTGPKQMAFARYWQDLLSAHEVNSTTDVSATAFADMDKGIDASWLSSAWGPSYFLPDAKSSLGDWRATALPQWTAGANVAALPLMVPGVLTVLLINVVAVWNNYFLPLLIFNVNTRYPLTAGLGLWSDRAVNSGNANLYPMLVMGGLVTIIPLIALFLFLQRYWRGGMLLGSIAN